MKKIQLILLAISLIAIMNCGSDFNYIFDFNENHDFTQYETYDFLRDDDTTGITVLNKDNIMLIEDEIADQIIDLGMFQKLDDPDLIIYYEASITGKKKSTAANSKYGAIFAEGHSYVTSDFGSYKDQEGTLTIYFYDLRQRQIVWKGSVYGLVGEDREKHRGRVLEAIGVLFEEYPLKKK